MNPAEKNMFYKRVASGKQNSQDIEELLLSSLTFPDNIFNHILLRCSDGFSPLRFDSADPQNGQARLNPEYDNVEINTRLPLFEHMNFVVKGNLKRTADLSSLKPGTQYHYTLSGSITCLGKGFNILYRFNEGGQFEKVITQKVGKESVVNKSGKKTGKQQNKQQKIQPERDVVVVSLAPPPKPDFSKLPFKEIQTMFKGITKGDAPISEVFDESLLIKKHSWKGIKVLDPKKLRKENDEGKYVVVVETTKGKKNSAYYGQVKFNDLDEVFVCHGSDQEASDSLYLDHGCCTLFSVPEFIIAIRKWKSISLA